MLRLVFLLLLAMLLAPLNAVVRSFKPWGFEVNLPESTGWQPIPAPEIPGLTVLVAMQNSSRGAVFGVNVLNNPPNTNLRDPATTKMIESMLRSFLYDFAGSAMTTIGGVEWKQYRVTSTNAGRPVSGLVRYAASNGKIYGVTMLLEGGREAAQDLELQAAAASVRFFPPVAEEPPPPEPAPTEKKVEKTPVTPPAETKPTPAAAAEEPQDYVRLAWIIGGAIVVILILLKIVGGGNAPPKR